MKAVPALLALLLAGCATTAAQAPSSAVMWAKGPGSNGPLWARRLAGRESCVVEHLPGEGNRNLMIGMPGGAPRVAVHFRGKKTDEKEAMNLFVNTCGLPPESF